MQGFDIIGDIHGYGGTLSRLLTRLGYEPDGSLYRHPSRTAIFVGDIINRGPNIREALEIVRGMCEHGSALMVLGNHEVEALRCWLPDGRGLRPGITPMRRERCRETLRQLAEPSPEDWRGYLLWFRSLPLYLDFPGFRVVHACWAPDAIEALGWMRGIPPMTTAPCEPRRRRLLRAVRTLTDGPDFAIPGSPKPNRVRSRWWVNPETTPLADAVLPTGGQLPTLPHAFPSTAQTRAFRPYPPDERPVFFGHYAFPGHPLPYRSNIACLDLGLARGEALCAYRWSGEREISRKNFVVIQARG